MAIVNNFSTGNTFRLLLGALISILALNAIWLPQWNALGATASFTVTSPQVPDATAPISRPLIGIYSPTFLDDKNIQSEVVSLDQWTGIHATLIGFFVDLGEPDPSASIMQAEHLWKLGYTSFIDLGAGAYNKPTAYDIASGKYDSAITSWAKAYAAWAVNGKYAYMAPLSEMNTPWASYGFDPENYRLAYDRIQNIFAQNGVTRSEIRWVFAPNGWTHHPFEAYYPGDSKVDIIGFSAFNYGFCPVGANSKPAWDEPELVFGPFIREMRRLSPNKPIFITRAGTTAYSQPGMISQQAKDDWLRKAYAFFATQPKVAAVIYYNVNTDCDWSVYKQNSYAYNGYRDGIKSVNPTYLTPSALATAQLFPTQNRFLYVSTVTQKFNPNLPEPDILLGAYAAEWPGTHRVVREQFVSFDQWAGKRLSIAATYVDLLSDPKINIELQLETLADNGYTPFVNINPLANSGLTAAMIAQGAADSQIQAMARAFRAYARNGTRMAFIAPLQEMNGSHVSYGLDPANWKLAFIRFQQIFANQGVPRSSIRWVFAPNGSSDWGTVGFEEYYPGDQYVDVNAFTAFHCGYCPIWPAEYQSWQTPEMVIGQYLQRMIALSPAKPIFISQTGTSAYTVYGPSQSAKDQFLIDMYNYIAGFPQVKSIIYLNWDVDCDWAVYHKNGAQYNGYRQAIANPRFGYIPPDRLINLNLAP